MPVHDQAPPPATSRRTAWVIVIIMSTLFVLALLGTIWGFVRQAHIVMAARSATNTAATPPASAGAAAVVTLAPGARILSATTDSGKLVLHVATPGGSEVDIVDLATGRLTGQVKTQDPPQK
jgi:flagellar basal body-associated protein FliL